MPALPAMPDFLGLIGRLTTIQLLLGLAAIGVGLWILKAVLSPGGPRKRMLGNTAVWIMIPFIAAIGGVIIYFVIKILANAPQVLT
jgi:hypothetical protein